MKITKLVLSWSTSKAAATYGYNICRLDDRETGKRYRTIGGGYDMRGEVFGAWLENNFQADLYQIRRLSHRIYDGSSFNNPVTLSLYGMTYNLREEKITLDGACGLDSMLEIARAIGLDVERDYIARGRRRGETIGWFISRKGSNEIDQADQNHGQALASLPAMVGAN